MKMIQLQMVCYGGLRACVLLRWVFYGRDKKGHGGDWVIRLYKKIRTHYTLVFEFRGLDDTIPHNSFLPQNASFTRQM